MLQCLEEGVGKMTSIFLAESADSVCEALQELIAETDGIELAGMAGDAGGAIEGFLDCAQGRVPPQVLIIDIQLADGCGLGVLQFIKRRYPLTRTIMLCDCASAMYREHCASQGADWFFDKTTEFHKVQDVLRGLAKTANSFQLDVAA